VGFYAVFLTQFFLSLHDAVLTQKFFLFNSHEQNEPIEAEPFIRCASKKCRVFELFKEVEYTKRRYKEDFEAT
jgi:hypothetical protein